MFSFFFSIRLSILNMFVGHYVVETLHEWLARVHTQKTHSFEFYFVSLLYYLYIYVSSD